MATDSDIVAAIDNAIFAMMQSGGVQTIKVGDKWITYQDLSELRTARKQYAASANASSEKLPFKLMHIKPRGIS